MKDAEIILKLIEDVSPDDTAKLDEIDNRVWEYLNSTKLGHKNYRSTPYTRSRDALKAIRPEGWKFSIHTDPIGEMGWAEMKKAIPGDGFLWAGGHEATAYELPTEELAELHAIIQAIAYERGGEGGV